MPAFSYPDRETVLWRDLGMGMLFLGLCALCGLGLYLIMRGAARDKDWEREDREQLEYLRRWAEERGDNR